ncbi:hypothetical protein KCP69_24195 [Salmonella enterica subsp. enterica]|nr:hypothetical protein KCP69_24195 [Salmonella enterica subsp. enterica]
MLYGLPWGITLYGGSQIAGDKYQSVALQLRRRASYANAQGHFTGRRIWSHRIDDGRKEIRVAIWRVRYSKGVVQYRAPRFRWPYRYASTKLIR